MGSHKNDKTPEDPGPPSFDSSHYRGLYHFLRRHLPHQEVEDVLHEAYCRFMEAAPQTPIRNAQGYIHGIAWKVVCDFRSARSDARVKFDSDKADHGVATSPALPTDPVLEQVAAIDELERALEGLTPSQRAVLLLDKGHGYTDEEIASLTGLSVHTVKKYSTVAIQRLRERDKASKWA